MLKNILKTLKGLGTRFWMWVIEPSLIEKLEYKEDWRNIHRFNPHFPIAAGTITKKDGWQVSKYMSAGDEYTTFKVRKLKY